MSSLWPSHYAECFFRLTQSGFVCDTSRMFTNREKIFTKRVVIPFKIHRSLSVSDGQDIAKSAVLAPSHFLHSDSTQERDHCRPFHQDTELYPVKLFCPSIPSWFLEILSVRSQTNISQKKDQILSGANPIRVRPPQVRHGLSVVCFSTDWWSFVCARILYVRGNRV